MGVGAGLYMYDVVVEKFTFAISSPDEFLSVDATVERRGGGWEAEAAAVSYQRTVAQSSGAILRGRENVSSRGSARHVPRLLQTRSTVSQGTTSTSVK